VRGKRKQVDAHIFHVHWNLADCLGGIRMKQNSLFLRYLAYLTHRFESADLIVSSHYRDENRFVGESIPQFIKIDQAVCPHRQISHSITFSLQCLTAVQHRLVFDCTSDDVITLLRIGFGYPFDCDIVRFGGTAGENYLPRRCRMNQGADLFARTVHCRFTLPTEYVITA
jgi:hypothetical protein